MASLWYNKAKNQYCTDLCIEGRRRRVFFGADKQQAEAELATLLRRVKESTGSDGLPMSLVTLAEQFLAWAQVNKAPATYDFYRRYLSWFVSRHRDLAAADLTPPDLEGAKTELIKAGRSNATVNHVVSLVKNLYSWGMRMGYLSANPVSYVAKLPKTPPPTRVLSLDEEVRLLKVCEPDLREIITVFLRTGLRSSELANLTWDGINMEAGTVTITNRKNSRTAKNPIPLVLPMHEDVRRILRAKRKRTGLVFPNKAGKPYTKDSLGDRFRRACKRAGIVGVHIHTLRHTVATRLVESGQSLEMVARLLGHTSTRMTERYAHLNVESVRAALSNLPVPQSEDEKGRILKLHVG